MHYIAPIPIMFGVLGVVVGLIWLVMAGSEENGPPDSGFMFIFGRLYLSLRVFKQLVTDPKSVLPGFGILIVSAGLIWLGSAMW